MSARALFLFIHRWLGLISGLVVFIVALTGCLFVFQKEISESIWKEKYFVEPGQQMLPLSVLLKNAQQVLGPQMPVQSVDIPKDSRAAWEFMAYKTNDTALTYFGAVEYFQSAFVDPYTGRATGVRDYKYDFFNIVKYLHWSLLFNTKYGQPVVGWSTLVFVLLLITGLVLWLPRRWKNRNQRKQAFTIKWKARFKRLNYDLHNVLGFYALLFALVLALTGMVFSFQWFSSLVYIVASGTTQQPEQKSFVSDEPETGQAGSALDKAQQAAFVQFRNARRIGIYLPADKKEPIYFYGYRGAETYYGFDEMQFDAHSGKLLSVRYHKEKNRGEKLLEMNYDIHVGAIGGITGKTIAFFASLICASLPVTGFYIWWGRRKKKYAKPLQARNTSAHDAVLL